MFRSFNGASDAHIASAVSHFLASNKNPSLFRGLFNELFLKKQNRLQSSLPLKNTFLVNPRVYLIYRILS